MILLVLGLLLISSQVGVWPAVMLLIVRMT